MSEASPSRRHELTVIPEAGLGDLEAEWDDLALKSGALPFARPGWIRAWWSAFGHGELQILTLRSERELRSVLPLARYRGALHACANVHSPVFEGVSSGPEGLKILLVEALRETGRGIVLSQLDVEGDLLSAARQIEGAGEGQLVMLESEPSPYVDASHGWEAFERALSKNRRQKARRTRRRLDEQGEITLGVADGSEDLDACFDEFLRLEGSGWKVEQGTAIFQNPDTERFYRDIATWAASEGLLRISFMRLNKTSLAAEFTIDDGVHRHMLKLGYDPEFSRYGPGVLLQLEEIRSALDDGRSYEMGTGMNGIKEEFGNAERTIDQIALFPRSVRGTAFRRTFAARHALYREAREIKVLRRARDVLRRGRSRLRG